MKKSEIICKRICDIDIIEGETIITMLVNPNSEFKNKMGNYFEHKGSAVWSIENTLTFTVFDLLREQNGAVEDEAKELKERQKIESIVYPLICEMIKEEEQTLWDRYFDILPKGIYEGKVLKIEGDYEWNNKNSNLRKALNVKDAIVEENLIKEVPTWDHSREFVNLKVTLNQDVIVSK